MRKTITPYRDLSLDLETLSLRHDAAIISIGCVEFDRYTGEFGAEFYREVEFESAVKSGHVSGETLRWWMERDERAKRVFLNAEKKFALAVALDEFTTWVRSRQQNGGYIWANGPAEDISWMRSAYVAGCVGLQPPWHYSNVRDMRTILDAAMTVDPSFKVKWARDATHHALQDAKDQAKAIAQCFTSLTGGKPAKKAAPVKQAAAASTDDDPL